MVFQKGRVLAQDAVEDLLDKVVANDPNVTRREEQLDQLCNILLLKLESDKEGKSARTEPVFLRSMENSNKTAMAIKRRYEQFVDLYPEVFISDQDKRLRFSNATIAACVVLPPSSVATPCLNANVSWPACVGERHQ